MAFLFRDGIWEGAAGMYDGLDKGGFSPHMLCLKAHGEGMCVYVRPNQSVMNISFASVAGPSHAILYYFVSLRTSQKKATSSIRPS